MMFSVLGSFFMSEKRVRKTWSEKHMFVQQSIDNVTLLKVKFKNEEVP